MRQIKASEIQPGMAIRWTHNKVTYECPVMGRDGTDSDGGVLCHVTEEHSQYVNARAGAVTVLSEPQPEEPTAFGARVVADGHEFLLSHGGRRSWKARLDGKRYAWTDLCDMGSVVVIDATPSWTVPEQATETPEVPERIEEWPEDDTALRPYQWRERDGDTWTWLTTTSEWECYDEAGIYSESAGHPFDGPWTRVPHA